MVLSSKIANYHPEHFRHQAAKKSRYDGIDVLLKYEPDDPEERGGERGVGCRPK
jgi:hypothetical protein